MKAEEWKSRVLFSASAMEITLESIGAFKMAGQGRGLLWGETAHIATPLGCRYRADAFQGFEGSRVFSSVFHDRKGVVTLGVFEEIGDYGILSILNHNHIRLPCPTRPEPCDTKGGRDMQSHAGRSVADESSHRASRCNRRPPADFPSKA